MNFFYNFVCVLILIISGVISDIRADETADTTQTTIKEIVVESAGIGSEFQQEIEEASNLIASKNYIEGHKKIVVILEKFQNLLNEDDVIYISVSSDKQYQDFIAKNSNKKIRRTSWELQKALFLKAFLAVEHNDLDNALTTLGNLLKIAPYSSTALCEQGYLFNRKGEYEKSLQSYQQAADIAEEFPTEKYNLSIALRGAGYALTKLQRYEKAREAYTASLRLEPNNEIAMNGIAIINHLENTNQ